jgi:hypothetical protein
MTCKDCRFFFIIKDGPVEPTKFECHRRSPVMFGWRNGPQGEPVFGFPNTNPYNWCGEIEEWPKMEANHD